MIETKLHSLKYKRPLPVRGVFKTENLFLEFIYEGKSTFISTLEGVHHLTLKEIEYGVLDFFSKNKLSTEEIIYTRAFFNMTKSSKIYHDEIIFAIEAILLNSINSTNYLELIKTNSLYDWKNPDNQNYKTCACLKIKINPKTDVLKLSQILNSLIKENPTIKFRLDANRNFELNELLIFLNALKENCHFRLSDSIEYLEEPLKSHNDLLDYKQLQNIPYAVDESSLSLLDNKTHYIDAFVLKPSLFGISKLYDFIENCDQSKKVIISSCFEHPSVLNNLAFLAQLRPLDAHGIIAELS